MATHSSEEGLRLLARAAELGPNDAVLDVACGPGLVACALAPLVKTMRGLDVVDAMLEQATSRAAKAGLGNVAFEKGDATRLPFPDESFDRVITRYSLHHLLEPEITLREMARVCRKGGTITVCDVAPAREKLAYYNELEKIRDPSHTSALCPEELAALFTRARLTPHAREQYRLETQVEEIVNASFPDPGGAEKLRKMFSADVGVDALGVGVENRNGALMFAFPILILSARKP